MKLCLGPIALNLAIVAIVMAMVACYSIGRVLGYRKVRRAYGDMLRRAGSRFGTNDL